MAATRSCPVWNFRDAALLGQHRYSLLRFVVRKVLDRLQQLRVLLAHDPVELRGLHPGFLHLLEGSARIDALVLAGVTDDEYAVVWVELVEKSPHLLGAGKARLVEHVEMPVGRVGARVVLASGKESSAAWSPRSRPRGAGPPPWRSGRSPRPCTRSVPLPRGWFGASSSSLIRPSPAARGCGPWTLEPPRWRRAGSRSESCACWPVPRARSALRIGATAFCPSRT